MRILYGVTGEGLGHTMRARVLVAHLRARGHTVKIAASGRAAKILARHHDDVVPIAGLRLVQERGQLERLRTVAANARS
ncbi:MAG TPA: glycosyltransferase family protein, partial [Polyangia bacterium]